MAYKDKLKEKQYQKEYYEKHKKLKGRKRKSKVAENDTLIRNTKVARREKKRAIKRKLKSFKEKWSRMSKAQKKKNKKNYLNKLQKLKKSVDKYFGGKSKQSNKVSVSDKSKDIEVATDMSYSTKTSNTFGKSAIGQIYEEAGSQLTSEVIPNNVSDALEQAMATKVKTIKSNTTVSKLLSELLKRTGSKKSKKKK